MAKKKFFVGIAVLLLTFGLVLTGCDDGSGDGNDGGGVINFWELGAPLVRR